MKESSHKYILGLTGNIGTGKSVIRRMLEHLGAYGIDADALAHRVLSPAGPGYQPVIDLFGEDLIAPNGELDRGALGRIVFSDKSALEQLENIIHPYVLQAVDNLVARSNFPVIVIEAIKLLETDLAYGCNSIWVASARKDIQVDRLVKNREMLQEDALLRITSQAPQYQKIKAAHVVIDNSGSFRNTWKLVKEAWTQTIPLQYQDLTRSFQLSNSGNVILHAAPDDAKRIASFINRMTKDEPPCYVNDILSAFSKISYILLMNDTEVAGLVEYQVDDMVGWICRIILDPATSNAGTFALLAGYLDKLLLNLQCECSFIAIPTGSDQELQRWREFGYELCQVNDINQSARKKIAQLSGQPEIIVLFKQHCTQDLFQPV